MQKQSKQDSQRVTKATPGPWEISRDAVPEYHTQLTVYAEQGGERVATAFICEANARLIAAAPELLEALRVTVALVESMIRTFDHCGGKSFGVPTLAVDAITKAEGRS